MAARAYSTGRAALRTPEPGDIARPFPPIPNLRAWLDARCEQLSDELQRLIALLDTLDGDCDLEPGLGSPEQGQGAAEFFLSRRQIAPSFLPLYADQSSWAGGAGDHEEEEANEDGGNILDEPHHFPHAAGGVAKVATARTRVANLATLRVVVSRDDRDQVAKLATCTEVTS